MGKTLEPAFHLMKLKRPKREAVKKEKVKYVYLAVFVTVKYVYLAVFITNILVLFN